MSVCTKSLYICIIDTLLEEDNVPRGQDETSSVEDQNDGDLGWEFWLGAGSQGLGFKIKFLHIFKFPIGP